jgi:outer membrane protein assembly factor BamB
MPRPPRQKKVSVAPQSVDWTGWRGTRRDGYVAWLPDEFPAELKLLWKKRLRSPEVGGVSATSKRIVVSGRESSNTSDGFRCFDATDGTEVWKLTYPAKGDLDYGNSPRATPQIQGDLVYLLGAFGHLHCVKFATGDVVWKKDLRSEFHVTSKMVWGHSSSPLLVDGKLIVNPGAADAAVVALDLQTGSVLWKSPGDAAAFASFISANVAGRTQIIGYDAASLSGWDPADGRQLWKHVPPRKSDFNVPTPILWRDKLILCSENNGTRLHAFDDEGRLIDKPLAVNENLAPDTHTPVVIGDRLFGVWDALFCLDLTQELKPVWIGEGRTFQHYASLIASDSRLLVTGIHGEGLLVDATSDAFRQISRVELTEDDAGVFSHPAIVGDRLYLRTSTDVRCFALQ